MFTNTGKKMHLEVWNANVHTPDLDTVKADWVAGTWYEICFTHNATSKDTIVYVDGVSNNSGNTGIGAAGSDATMNMYIGSADTTPTGEALNGKLNKILLFNKVLTAVEVASVYNNNFNISGRMAAYYLNEGAGTKAYDQKGWQLLTNNVRQALKYPGNKPRLRIIETAASTATITQLKIGYEV